MFSPLAVHRENPSDYAYMCLAALAVNSHTEADTAVDLRAYAISHNLVTFRALSLIVAAYLF